MASISQGLFLTTAMLLSSTVLYLAFSKQKPSPPFHGNSNSTLSNKQILRSCLCTEEKKRERKKKNKKVKFAEHVMVKEVARDAHVENREEQSKQNRVSSSKCRKEIQKTRGMPENRIALYNGILRDRSYRMAFSH